MHSMTDSDFFPYDNPRPGQIKLIRSIREIGISGQHLCVEAANGFGKTIAALLGVLPLLQTRRFGAIYVARTHKQLDRVMEELIPLSEAFSIRGIVMRGRSSSCLNPLVTKYAPSPQLAMLVCSQLKRLGRCRYYQNLLRKVKRNKRYISDLCVSPLTGLQLREKCIHEHVCPYELTKLMLPYMTVVATTYYQIFNPEICSSFLDAFSRPLSRAILVIDEAHNLPRIAMELASARLSLNSIQYAISEAKHFGLSLVGNFCSALKLVIKEYIQNTVKMEIPIDPISFDNRVCNLTKISSISNFAAEMSRVSNSLTKQLLMKGKLPISSIHSLAKFLVQWCESQQHSDVAHFIVHYKPNPMASRLEIVSLDPRRATLPILRNCQATVHLSGTLQPIRAHIDLIGLPERTQILNLPSPFVKSQILPLISLGVTSALRYRTPGMFNKIAMRISEVCSATPHNVGVFVPSYSFLKDLLNAKVLSLLEKEVFIENPKLTSNENDSMIKSFKEKACEGAVLFGVLGGRNSEGEDYPGNEMETVVIVGVPYAKPNPRETVRINYLEHHFPSKGRLYGYVLPAMRNASQAAGRSVRRLEDTGAIVFLDNRYATQYCRQFLPNWITEKLKYVDDGDGLLFKQLHSFLNLKQ